LDDLKEQAYLDISPGKSMCHWQKLHHLSKIQMHLP